MKARWLTVLLSGLVLAMAFQNCGGEPQRIQFSESSKLPSIKNDSGYPYDGKLFFLTGNVCPDGTKVQARIKVRDASSAELQRENCQEIAPVTLSENEFQLVADRPEELIFKAQVFLNQLIGTKIDLSQVRAETGFAFWTPYAYDFGTLLWDSETTPTASTLQIYEDGKLLGPAHTNHTLIRDTGLGGYSHWLGHLYFSASDNTNPLTNGRTYSFVVP